MKSIAKMLIAVQRVKDGFQRVSSDDIIRIRDQDKKKYTTSIKDELYCYGCYRVNPQDLRRVVHFDDRKNRKTHYFRMKQNTNHVEGCAFHDPVPFIAQVAERYGLELADKQKGIIRLPEGQALAQPYTLNGYLQDLYDTFGDHWLDLSVEVQQQTVTIGDLLVPVDQTEGQLGRYCLVKGKSEQVLITDQGMVQIEYSPNFRLEVKPGNPLAALDLTPLVGREIACYGKVERQEDRGCKMELLAMKSQVVFLDGEVPSLNPQVGSIDQIWKEIEQVFPVRLTRDQLHYAGQEGLSALQAQLSEKSERHHSLSIELKELKRYHQRLLAKKESWEERWQMMSSNKGSIEEQLRSIKESLNKEKKKWLRIFAKKKINQLMEQKERQLRQLKRINQRMKRLKEAIETAVKRMQPLEERIEQIGGAANSLNQEIVSSKKRLAELHELSQRENVWRQTLSDREYRLFMLANDRTNWLVAIDVEPSEQDRNQVHLICHAQQCTTGVPIQLVSDKVQTLHKVISLDVPQTERAVTRLLNDWLQVQVCA